MPEGTSTVPAFETSKWKGILEDWKKEQADANGTQGNNKEPKKIIIVGAGAAGLYAAYTLQCLGFENYEIVEASGTIGGRLSENTDFIDLPLDEGAEWIHFSPSRILEDLLLEDKQDFDVETFPYMPQTYGFYSKGENHQRNWVKNMHKVYVEHKFTSTTWFSYLEQYILAKIPKEKLRLNTPVKTIDSTDPKYVKITTANGEVLTGTHAIVAVPLGVLQADDVISFVPPMPSAWTDELNQIDFACGYKAWFLMKEKFYSDVQQVGKVIGMLNPTSELTYFDGVLGKPTEANVLATLQTGKKAAERSQLSDEELTQVLLTEIDDMYEGKGTEHVLKSVVKNWSAEPYIRGAYSVSIWHDKELLRQGVPGKVLFAGEYLGKPQIAVQGALLSGRFAVEALLESTTSPEPSTWSRMAAFCHPETSK